MSLLSYKHIPRNCHDCIQTENRRSDHSGTGVKERKEMNHEVNKIEVNQELVVIQIVTLLVW